MAVVHRIANYEQTTTYDFLTAVLKPMAGGWMSSLDSDGRVVETMQLVARDATDGTIIAAVNAISELAEAVNLFFDSPFQKSSIWYEYSATAETTKRALIYNIQIMAVSNQDYLPTLGKSGAYYSLIITHSSAWEDVSASTAWVKAGTNCFGGTETISAIKGNLPARLNYFSLTAIDAAVGPIVRSWIGIRPTRYGISSFEPVWELEDAAGGTDAAVATQTGASPSGSVADNAMSCSFATQTGLRTRATIKIADVIGDTNYTHFIGSYVVLLRYKLSASGVVGLQLASGFENDSVKAAQEEKFVTATSWRLVELGEVNIPPFAYRSNWYSDASIADFALAVKAERISGTPTIYLDALVLIPSEHYAASSNGNIFYVASPEEFGQVRYWVNEEGEGTGFSRYELTGSGATGVNSTLDYVMRNWEVPIEGGLVVIAGERSASHDLDDELTLGALWYLRHRVHREA